MKNKVNALSAKERKKFIRKRFAYEGFLGKISEIKDIKWPDYTEEHEEKGNHLVYKRIADVEKNAERIAEIFRRGIDELAGNKEYEWHHDPEKIVEKYHSGDWNFYGVYCENKLISVVSMLINRGRHSMQWVWGCVDPEERGKGVWKYHGRYLDRIVEKSGAQMGIVFCVTTHALSQRNVEAAGYRPIGCFAGGEIMGGSDGQYYRQNVIYYGKLYGQGMKLMQPFDTMQLAPMAEELVKVIKKWWEK